MRALAVRATLAALAAIIVWQGAGLMFPPEAGAHAVRERSVPEQNQQLQSPPERVEIWFTEEIDPALTTVRVLDAAGGQIDTGDTSFSDDPFYASVGIQRDRPPGVYTVVYENLSKADGHKWQGFFPFVVLNPDGSAPETAVTPLQIDGGGGGQGFLPDWKDGALRWASLLAAVALAGSAIFYLFVLRPASDFLENGQAAPIRQVSSDVVYASAALSAAVLFLSAAGQLALLVDRLGGISRLGDIVLDTRTGQLWLARLGLALALGTIALIGGRISTLNRREYVVPSLLALGAAGVVMTYALGSHAAAAEGTFAATTSDFVHFLATGIWLGLLLHLAWLWRLIRRDITDPERLLLQANVLDRFSVLTGASVGLLLASGVFNAFVQLPTLESLWETTYGRTLIAKLALVVPLLGIAGINAFFLKPALVNAVDAYHGQPETDDDDELTDEDEERLKNRIDRLRRALPRTIALELALGAAVLASVAILVQTATAEGEIAQQRAEAKAARVAEGTGSETFEFSAVQIAGDLFVALRINPLVVGINTFEVGLDNIDPQEEVVGVRDVSLRVFYADPTFGSTDDIPLAFDRNDPEQGLVIYQTEGAYFSLGGGYRVQVDIRRSDRDDLRAIFPLDGVGKRPEERAGFFEMPFDLGTGGIVGASALLLASIGLLLWRHQFGVLAPWAQRGAEIGGALALLGGLLFAGGEVLLTDEATGGNPIALTNQSVEAGQVVFERNCMACHGQGGRGDGPAGRNLNPPPADFLVHVPYHPDTALFNWVTTGIGQMPPFGERLTEEERWNLVNYLRKTFGQSEGGFVVPGTDTPSTPESSPGVTPTPTAADDG
ncbi:MAG: CopD family protein [Dehalococcoidia bacterium]